MVEPMHIVELTLVDGRKIALPIRRIVAIAQTQNGGARVYSGGETFNVQEELDDIYHAIHACMGGGTHIATNRDDPPHPPGGPKLYSDN